MNSSNIIFIISIDFNIQINHNYHFDAFELILKKFDFEIFLRYLLTQYEHHLSIGCGNTYEESAFILHRFIEYYIIKKKIKSLVSEKILRRGQTEAYLSFISF